MGCQLEPPSFQSLLERGGVRMKRDQSFYFFIELMSQHNPSRVIRAIWDSGAKASISCTRFLEDQKYFLNERLEAQRSIQTVGCATSNADLHRVLIPVNNQSYSHYMTHTLSVQSIIDPVPHRNMQAVMNRAYKSYCHDMGLNGVTPVPHTQWPDGNYGGKVDFLLGVADLDFKLVYNFHGLIFISHDLKATKSIAVGGSFDLNSFQPTHADQILVGGMDLGDLDPTLGDTSHDMSHDGWQRGMSRDTSHDISWEASHDIQQDMSHDTSDIKGVITHRGGGKKSHFKVPNHETKKSAQIIPHGVSACRDMFKRIGIQVPNALVDASVVHTPGISGNCLFYTLARFSQDNPTHTSVRQLREDFKPFLLSRAEEIYCKEVFPLSLYCLSQGELVVHDIEQIKIFINGPCWSSYFLTQFEMLPLADYLNLTIDLHIVSEKPSHSQTVYGMEGNRPWVRIFQHQDHYSGIVSEGDTHPLTLDYGPDIIIKTSYNLDFPALITNPRPPSPIYKTVNNSSMN